MKKTALILALIVSLNITLWAVVVCISTSVTFHKSQNAYQYGPNNQNHDSNASESSKPGAFTDDKQGTPNRKNGDGNEVDWVARAIAVAGFIVSLYALRAASRNADAANRSADIAEDTARRQLRAKLSFRIVRMNQIRPDEMFVYWFKPTNHGPSPATKLAFRGFSECVPVGDAVSGRLPKYDGQKWDEDRLEVFLGESSGEINCTTGFIFTKENLSLMNKGTHTLVTGVQLRYVDGFDREQFVEQAMRITGSIDNPDIAYIPGTSRST